MSEDSVKPCPFCDSNERCPCLGDVCIWCRGTRIEYYDPATGHDGRTYWWTRPCRHCVPGADAATPEAKP